MANWFERSSWDTLLKQAVSTVEGRIDKALDISEGNKNVTALSIEPKYVNLNPPFKNKHPSPTLDENSKQFFEALLNEPKARKRQARQSDTESATEVVMEKPEKEPQGINLSANTEGTEHPEESVLPCSDNESSSKNEIELLSSNPTELQTLENLKAELEQVKIDMININYNHKIETSKMSDEMDKCYKILEAKDKQIQDLIMEGEALSKQELKTAGMIKKYRAKEAESESAFAELNKKYDTARTEIEFLKKSLHSSQEAEKTKTDSITNLTESNENQIQKIITLEAACLALQEKENSLQAALDRSWNEQSELRKQLAESNSQLQSDALEKEGKLNLELRRQLNEYIEKTENDNKRILKDNLDYRSKISRLEDECGWREDQLRKENMSLQRRIQEADERSQELEASIEDSTKPLVRQLDLLQKQHSNSLKDWEYIERRFTARIQATEEEKITLSSKIHFLKEKIEELNTKLMTTEAHLLQEKQKNSSISADLKAEAINTSNLLQDNLNLKVTLEKLQQHVKEISFNHQKALEEAQSNIVIKDESRNYIVQVNQEPQTVVAVEKLKSSTPILSPSENPSSKNLDGAIKNLKIQLKMATQTRDELADELVVLTNENETLKIRMREFEKGQLEKEELEKRYTLTLEILGGKTEKCNELQADIEDLKELLKLQFQNFSE